MRWECRLVPDQITTVVTCKVRSPTGVDGERVTVVVTMPFVSGRLQSKAAKIVVFSACIIMETPLDETPRENLHERTPELRPPTQP